MSERKSIVLYLDSEQQWEMLSNEQAGILIKALLKYSVTGERIKTDDGMMLMAFSFMSAQIDRDGAKYDEKCERNRRIALEREEKRRAERERTETDVHERARTCTSVTDNNNNNNNTDNNNNNNNNTDNNTNNDNDIIIMDDKPKKKIVKTFRPPTLDEVKAYCAERGNNVDAERLIDYYTANGWRFGKNPMKDWKAAVRTWEKQGWNGYGYGGEKKQKSKDGFDNDSFDADDFDKLVNNWG